MFFETAKLAWRAISRNMLRSFLTVLGVVIGVAAVIAMVTVGNGTTAKVQAELSRLGTNTLFVRPGQWGPGRASSEAKRFNDKDVLAIQEQVPGLRAVAPVNRGTATVIAAGANHSSSVIGTNNDYLTAQDWDLSLGRTFLANEDRGSQAACIIGETVRKELLARPIRSGRISASAMSPALSSACSPSRDSPAWATIRTIPSSCR